MTIRGLSLLAVAAGVGMLAVAVATGRAEVGLLVVVPFVVGSGPLPVAGVLLVMVGMVGLFVGTARDLQPPPSAGASPGPKEPVEGTGETRAGGVVMIGPIPIVVGSDRRTAILAALGGVLVLLGLVVWIVVYG